MTDMMQGSPSPAPSPPQGTPAASGAPPPSPVGAPGANPQPQQVPQFIENPDFTKWQQAAQAVQAVQQANQQKQQQFDAAVALIKQDGVHGFRIDIEADSTIAPDEQQEQQNRTMFVKELVPLLGQVVPLAQGNPALATLAKEITLFAVRGFRVARPLEESLEQAFDAIAKMPPHPSTQPKGGSNVDSPADLALRGKELDQRGMVEQQKLAQNQEKIDSAERIATMKEMATDRRDHQNLAFKTEHSAHQQALSAVRMTHLEAADAAKLT